MMPTFADPSEPSLPLWLLRPETLGAWMEAQAPERRAWVEGAEFDAAPGAVCLLPGPDGAPAGALAGLGAAASDTQRRFTVAAAASGLPGATWRIATELDDAAAAEAALGWLLAGYGFARYAPQPGAKARLIAPGNVDAARQCAIAAGELLTRDLINTPASDMGPAALEAASRALAGRFGASVAVTLGADLLGAGLPLVHAVGRAAADPPRMIDIAWGENGPLFVLVGKGVCFDTGGLNLKSGRAMALMKKDMGGAATALGLAQMIMAARLPLRLRLLVPAVENAVAGDAMRPGDILTARNGLTVEINNTDAEGRLVLADALALAAESGPDLLVSMATLTGAARAAVGPDIAPFFAGDDGHAAAISRSAARVRDPVWRLPFWEPYEEMIAPGIADLDNAPAGGFAGAIAAALFLRRFAAGAPFVHFDIYAWQPKPAPGRPRGGVGQGARALFDALPALLDL